MWPEALTFEHRVAHGESLDFSIAVPLDYQPGEDNPRLDGSRFRASFRLSPADRDVALHFESGASAPPFVTTGDWDSANAKLVLAFQASRAQILALRPAIYRADLIHERPRQGPLGPMCARVGVISLEVTAGGLE